MVCINAKSEEEEWVLNEEVMEFIWSHAQTDEIEVIYREGEGELEMVAI